MVHAKKHLQASVEIWLNGDAEAPMMYDTTWKGLINCGCNYNENGTTCTNRFPSCPALTDTGNNFGNGFYNDHHFHYGYHIYAASVVSMFNHTWAKQFEESVLMFIRDIANPSTQDVAFPTFRNKDWFLGSSWASGLCLIGGMPNTNGRDQESSSEAINAGEAVGLFGKVFAEIYSDDEIKYLMYNRMHTIGRIMFTTELRAAQNFWHILNPAKGVERVYPSAYTPNVVGNLWSLMIDFQTWFGNSPFLCYGIQLIPLTPSAVYRDDPTWVREMVVPYNESCMTSPGGPSGCVEDGWSIPLISSYAAIGEISTAWEMALTLNSSVFLSSGGNGHSLTNLLWYISVRESML